MIEVILQGMPSIDVNIEAKVIDSYKQVDSSLSTTSENPVMNKIVTEELNKKAAKEDVTAALNSKADNEEVNAKLTELSEEKGKFDDDALYVSDAKGNLIATINADGIRTTDVEVEGGKVSQLFAAILSKLDKEIDSDFFQIQDTNGNIAFRVDNGGVYSAKSDSWVVSVVLGDAYIPTSILRNEKGDVASAEIIFPDGQKGNIVITNQDANGVKGMTIGYNNKSIGVVIDRDSQGNVSKININ